MIEKINSEYHYSEVMSRIEDLMVKGSDNVSKDGLAEIRSLALIAQEYEAGKYIIDSSSSYKSPPTF